MRHDAVMKVLNDPIAQELLRGPLLARMGYVGPDGFPRVIPTGFHWDGERFVVCTAVGAPKVRALQANPKVGLTVDTPTSPPHVLLVRGTATVEIVDGVPTEFLEASTKALPREQHQAFEAQSRALYERMARIAIQPTWAKVLDFETRLPIAIEEIVSRRS